MRTRHSVGGVRKQRGRWIGCWRESGVKKSKVLGFVNEMTKGEAREAVAKIVAAERAKSEGKRSPSGSSSSKFTFGSTAGSGRTRRGRRMCSA